MPSPEAQGWQVVVQDLLVFLQGSPDRGTALVHELAALDVARVLSEITLKAEMAHPALNGTSLEHNVVARLRGE